MAPDSERGLPLALITGACGGMGLGCSRRLGARYELVLTDIDSTRLGETARRLEYEGCRIAAVVVGGIDDVDTLAALASEGAGVRPYRVIVHTAAVSPAFGDWRDILRVNVIGTERLLRALAPTLAGGSAMVMIASMAGHLAAQPSSALLQVLDDPEAPDFMARMEQLLLEAERPGSDLRSRAYGLSKWWMLRQCERLAPAWGRRGARITTVSPGMIDTPMGRREALDERVAALIESAPLARWGRPVEIADAVEFLVSERAAFITGADLRVDGGAVCKRRESGT